MYNPYQNQSQYYPSVQPYRAYPQPVQQPNPPMVVPPAHLTLPGRVINSVNEVTPQEVPMDGSISLFPLSDYSKIYAKAWTSDGKIMTYEFTQAAQETAEKPDPMSPILERLDRIEEMLSKPKSTSTRSTKSE